MMNDVVQTRLLEIVSKEGRVVARLGATDDGRPNFVMLNCLGKELVKLELEEDGEGGGVPDLRLMSPDGKLMVDIGLDNGAGGFHFSSGSGEMIAFLGGNADGESQLIAAHPFEMRSTQRVVVEADGQGFFGKVHDTRPTPTE